MSLRGLKPEVLHLKFNCFINRFIYAGRIPFGALGDIMNLKHLENCTFIGAKGISALSSKTVTIVGLGGVGSTLAQILVRNGISLRIVDKARVDEKDVARQTLYIQEDITKFKAKQAKKRLEEINKDIIVKSFHEDLHEDNVFLLEADIIVDVSNDMNTSLLVDAFTSSKKITTFFANYSGEKGHIHFVKGKQPTVKKIQDKLTLEPIKKEGVFSPITTVLAGLLASKIIKELVGAEVDERLLSIDLLKGELKRTNLSSSASSNSKTTKVAKKAPAKKSAKKKTSKKK